MDLKEYLMEELQINIEQASKLESVFEEYRKKYGHHHNHGEENKNRNVFEMVLESKDECEKKGYELNRIHCNGCPRNCSLDNPNCGRGIMLQTEFKKMK